MKQTDRSSQASVAVRSYRGGDEPGILALWNRTCPQDPIAPATFYKKTLLDPNFDAEGMRVAEADGEIVGYVQAVDRKVALGSALEPEMGWITAIMVDSRYRRQGIGTTLLQQAEAYLTGHQRKTVEFSPYAPHYVLPGLDKKAYPGASEFFARRGYTLAYAPVAMDKLLFDYEMPADVHTLRNDLRRQDVHFHPITPAYFTRVLDFTEREFYSDWTRSIREALAAGLPAERVWICREGETVLGFAMFGAYDGNLERFGPFGVADSQRGRGLGKVLLYLVLEEMKRSGGHSAWFLWTGERSPAGYLYHRAGFQTTRTFDILTKPLGSV